MASRSSTTVASAARFLGLDKGAQRSVQDQLGALATLREFARALGKCARQMQHKEAEAAKQAARRAVRRPSSALRW